MNESEAIFNVKPGLVDPLPDDKILALSKMEAFADVNFNVAKMVQFISDRVESISIFSCFQKAAFSRS